MYLSQSVSFTFEQALSGISQIDKIGNNGNIGIRGFTTWKKSSAKCYPQWE